MKLAKNVVRNANGQVLKVTDATSAAEYLEKFFGDTTELAGGQKKNMTKNGYSSASFARSQPEQALVKTALVSIHVLCDRAMAGDRRVEDLLKLVVQFAAEHQVANPKVADLMAA